MKRINSHAKYVTHLDLSTEPLHELTDTLRARLVEVREEEAWIVEQIDRIEGVCLELENGASSEPKPKPKSSGYAHVTEGKAQAVLTVLRATDTELKVSEIRELVPMSETTIRAALIQLEEQGLVETVRTSPPPNGGTWYAAVAARQGT